MSNKITTTIENKIKVLLTWFLQKKFIIPNVIKHIFNMEEIFKKLPKIDKYSNTHYCGICEDRFKKFKCRSLSNSRHIDSYKHRICLNIFYHIKSRSKYNFYTRYLRSNKKTKAKNIKFMCKYCKKYYVSHNLYRHRWVCKVKKDTL